LEHRSPRQKPSRGRRGGGGGSHDDFPGVEISIAGGVGEMVRANYCDRFFIFLFLSRLLIVSIGANAHLCSSHCLRYNRLSACNDPTIGSYNHDHLSPNSIPRGIQRWYGLVYFIQIAGKTRIRPR